MIANINKFQSRFTFRLGVLLALGCIGVQWGFASNLSATTIQMEAEEAKGWTVNDLLNQQIDFSSVDQLYNQRIVADGDIKQLLKELKDRISSANDSEGVLGKLNLILSYVHWRDGEMKKALENVDAGLALQETGELTLQKARLLDVVGRFDEALSWYQRAIPMLVGEEREQIQLRIALMEVEGSLDPLVKLAKERGNGFRNRAAVALAILGHEKEATELYQVEEDAKQSEKFRQRIRLADWALRSGDAPRAQEEAWAAVELAKLNRDRRYALALLVEGHRMDDTISSLIERFDQKESMTEDENSVRVELLRETGRFDEAVAAFKSNQDEWTPFLKRQLIGLYRESNRNEEIEREFLSQIEREPADVSWPRGLAEYFIEQGRRSDAEQVWQAYIDRNDHAGDLLGAAANMVQLGLDELAIAAGEKARENESSYTNASMFLFELYLTRGRLTDAEEVLTALDLKLPPQSLDRRDLADGYERIQQNGKALNVLKGLYDRGVELGVDGEMRVAWLQQSLGKNEEALASWYAMLDKTPSSQRRLVEDRILILSAELGRLGKMAVALEEKIMEKTAEENDARLLIKIYTKAGDAGSAIEIIEEFFGDGVEESKNVKLLREKASIFQFLGDYDSFGKVTNQLVKSDAEHRIEHVRSLILNHIENNVVNPPENDKRKLLRMGDLNKLIKKHNDWSDGEDSREFEAGVLELAGYQKKAIDVYRQALAANPERGDNYLVMANLMSARGKVEDAVRMFQYLGEKAVRDDLFVISMDGLLNMQSADPNVMKWAQRITLERLTGKSDKAYLYSLLSDLADDGGNVDLQLTALENSLSHANSRRAVTLRELIVLTDPAVGGFGNNAKKPDIRENLKFSRRLIALRQEFPPEVFINMGKTFLAASEPENAMKAFTMAVDATGRPDLMIEAARQFEKKGFDRQAMTQYEKSLIGNSGDLEIMWRLGELKERANLNDAANQLYRDGIQGILSRHPIQIEQNNASERVLVNSALDIPADVRQDPTKTDEYKRHLFYLRDGFIRTIASDDEMRNQYLAPFRESFKAELERVDSAGEAAFAKLSNYPRLSVTAQFLRFVALGIGDYQSADAIDTALLTRFTEDVALQRSIVATRKEWGQLDFEQAVNGYEIADATRTQLIEQWKQLDDPQFEPLVFVKQGKTRGVFAFGESNDSDLRLRMSFNVAVLSGDQERILDACREMVKEKMFSLALLRGRIALDDSNYLLLCQYVAQRVTSSQKEFEAAVLNNDDRLGFRLGGSGEKHWLEKVEETVGEPIFAEADLWSFVSRVKELERLNAGFVINRLSPANRIRFLNLIGPALEDVEGAEFGNSVLQSLLVAALQSPIPDEEVQVWKDLVSQHGRVYDGIGARFAAQFLENIEIAPENIELAKQISQTMTASTDESTGPSMLDINILYSSGDTETGVAGIINYFLNDRDPMFGAGLTPQQKRQIAESQVRYFVDENFEKYFKDFRDIALAQLAQIEKDNDGNEQLLRLRLELLERYFANDPAGMERQLSSLAETAPENELVLQRLRTHYRSHGLVAKEVEVLTRLLELHPDNRQYASQLVAKWKQLGQVVNAFNVKQKLPKAGGQNEQRNRPRVFGSNRDLNKLVREAKESGDPEQLRSLVRKLWQLVAVQMGQIEYSFDPDNQIFMDLRTFLDMEWPVDKKAETESDGSQSSESEPTKLIDALVEYEFSLEEFDSWIQAMRADEIDNVYPIYRALAAATVAHGDASKKLLELTEAIESGFAGDKELTLWLALVETKPDLVDERMMRVLNDHGMNADAMRSTQLLALAHIFAHHGKMDSALNCYQSIAGSSLSVSTEYRGRENGPTATSLAKDAKDHLDSAHYQDFLDAVLRLAAPPSVESESLYGQFILSSVGSDINDATFVERFGPWILRYANPGSGWTLDEVVASAYVNARCENWDHAVDALEFALKRGNNSMDALYGSRSNISQQMLMSNYQQMLGTNGADLRFYGPEETGPEETNGAFDKAFTPDKNWTQRADWVALVTQRMDKWLQDESLNTSRTLELAATLIEVQTELENPTAAKELATLVGETLKSRQIVSNEAVERVLNVTKSTDLKIDLQTRKRLASEGRISGEKMLSVLQDTLDQEGAGAALSLGTETTRYCVNEELLGFLITTAESSENSESLASLKQLLEETRNAIEAMTPKPTSTTTEAG